MIKQMFLEAPDNHIDSNLRPMIEEWSDPPTSLQMLKVLDAMVYGGSASGFVISVLDDLMRKAIVQEGTTFSNIVSQAHWRNL